MAIETIRTKSKAHTSMSEYFAKLEGGQPDDCDRTEGRNRSASHDEATIHSAFTTSGVSTGSRRRRKSKSSSLSGEMQSGYSNELQEPNGTRRHRKNSVQNSLDQVLGNGSENFQNSISHSMTASIASAPTVQHQARRRRY